MVHHPGAVALSLVWALSTVHGAVDLDGNQVMAPVTDNDPAPIVSIHTYLPDEHDCPLPCTDVTNVHSWVAYLSVERLQRCNEPMLLQTSVNHPADDPRFPVLIHACSLKPGPVPESVTKAMAVMQNPKTSTNLAERGIDAAKACFSSGIPSKQSLELFESLGSSDSNQGQRKPMTPSLAKLLEGLDMFFSAQDNCDENFAFAYHNGTIAGLYIGGRLGKATVSSALKALAQRGLWPSAQAAAQLCSQGHAGEQVFGVAIDSAGNLAAVQKTLSNWSKGTCLVNNPSGARMGGVEIFKLEGSITMSDSAPGLNSTTGGNTTVASSLRRRGRNRSILAPRATCAYTEVMSGDDCGKLAQRCRISSADFYKFNTKSDLCATLMPGQYICCSAGNPYVKPKPVAPRPGADGTCATHLIGAGDTCSSIAERYDITVDDIERWNKGRTWAWTNCNRILNTYNMCVSQGKVPLPPPAVGTKCGPLVPGTKPVDVGKSLADLNPCPLRACCSNWGYCGIFTGHCTVNAPPGGGPGSTPAGIQSTCISNCGQEIKKTGGPPAEFQRIGYYESWNLGRDCLWLEAKHANTDDTYTHIHWAFADIDPNTWKPVINDTFKQWAGFKALPNVKKIVAFGGWAYSTEAPYAYILRRAILENGNAFAKNIAQFVRDEGLDGADMDWEYPGAPDIKVDGRVIGEEGDGRGYLNFLRTLKNELGASKSVSIAAPASFYYLKAFPIDQIASVIDYIVYMTYDLHGQWDAGKPNSFDGCASGYCIRSHINLTETYNALSIITKAGVPNRKIFVGEASYARTFRMREDSCWQPHCEFTGTPTESLANPGRCTKTAGYLAYAEILELMGKPGVQYFHDHQSNTDVMLYDGDYISYMTPTTKVTRRDYWKGFDFGGSIDWALDLQSFTATDMNKPADIPIAGSTGCNQGMDLDAVTDDLCFFTCNYGICPESLCECSGGGIIPPLPAVVLANVDDVVSWDTYNVEATRLCKFACKYGYCPPDACTTIDREGSSGPGVGESFAEFDPYDPTRMNPYEIRGLNERKCIIFKDPSYRHITVAKCEAQCKEKIDAAKAEGRTTNYGCVGQFPLDQPIPWDYGMGTGSGQVFGSCQCDHGFVNIIADLVVDAMPAIAQIGCYIVMSTLKLVIDVGLPFIPGGKIVDIGLDAIATAAQMANYVYNKDQDPQGAFEWWLSPCGGSELVPEELKKAFEILTQISEGSTSFQRPEKHGKGSGKKGDGSNPPKEDRTTSRAAGSKNKQPSGGNSGGKAGSGGVKKSCRIPPSKAVQRKIDRVRYLECVGGVTKTEEYVATSAIFRPNLPAKEVGRKCEAKWPQACYHYSSAASVSDWEKLPCPQEAAVKSRKRKGLPATGVWDRSRNEAWKASNAPGRAEPDCQIDEYPPIYLLNDQSPAWKDSGKSGGKGQLVRYLPGNQNGGAASMWNNMCYKETLRSLSNSEFKARVEKNSPTIKNPTVNHREYHAWVEANDQPYFTITAWEQPQAPNDGLELNPCWPSGLAPLDPGFALLDYDPYYDKNPSPYDYMDDP